MTEFLLKSLGMGLLIGFVLGFLFKKVSKIAIFLIAVLLIGLVLLGQNEIINIGWLTLKEQSNVLMEQAGQYRGSVNMIFRNVPFAIGIIMGALFGLKKG